jgi:hypothetical protein
LRWDILGGRSENVPGFAYDIHEKNDCIWSGNLSRAGSGSGAGTGWTSLHGTKGWMDIAQSIQAKPCKAHTYIFVGMAILILILILMLIPKGRGHPRKSTHQ